MTNGQAPEIPSGTFLPLFSGAPLSKPKVGKKGYTPLKLRGLQGNSGSDSLRKDLIALVGGVSENATVLEVGSNFT